MLRKRILLSAFFLMLSMTACTREKTAENTEQKKETIIVGFSEVGAESDWRVANTESMKNTFSEEKGYELIFKDARQKQDSQIAAIRNYILQEVDYIVLAPVIEEGWDEVLAEARDADIPVIVVDRMIHVEDESLYTAWVGSDFRKEGDIAVQWLEETLEHQNREEEVIHIVDVQGTEGASAQIGRTEALEAGVAKHKNWVMTAQVPGEFTQAKAYEVVLELLEQGTPVDVLYCENDNSAFGAMQALDEKGISYGVEGEVMILSFDATRAGLKACLEGKINLNVECNPINGPRVEAIILQLEQGITPDKKQYVEEEFFTQDNLTENIIDERSY